MKDEKNGMSYFLRDRLLLDLSPCIKREKKNKRARERKKEKRKGKPICECVIVCTSDCHHD